MIHYHGGPITPKLCAHRAWTGRHAFVSWARPDQIDIAADVSASFALDNGAFSLWKSGIAVDWDDYYEWTERWLRHPNCDWAIIPDVIGGSESDNNKLILAWPHGPEKGVPVWHLNESPQRLQGLAARFPRVALGSCAEYDVRRPSQCLDRLAEVLPLISDSDGHPTVKLHGLRMLNPKIVERVPLSSADSTNVARNIGIDAKWRHGPHTKPERALALAQRIESHLSPTTLQWPLTPAAAPAREAA